MVELSARLTKREIVGKIRTFALRIEGLLFPLDNLGYIPASTPPEPALASFNCSGVSRKSKRHLRGLELPSSGTIHLQLGLFFFPALGTDPIDPTSQ